MKFKKAMAFALTGALTAGAVCSGVFADNNQTTVTLTAAERHDTDYVLTIPAEVNVAGAGFTEFDGGIKVSHNSEKTTTFDPDSKVTVSASSTNEWQLKADGVAEGIGYQLKGSAEDNAATTSWEFTGDKITNDGETKAVGVDVENYDDAAPGDYTDTITFTAKAENTGIPVSSVAISNAPTEAMFVNSTGTLTATVSPDNATDKTVVWSSSDPDYVSINAETGEYTIMGTKGYGSATITATATNGTEDTSDDVTATCTLTGKVTYTSLSTGTVLHVGDTFYAGKVYFDTKPAVSFQDSNGVITLVEANGCYKFKRGSNGTMPNVTAYKIKDNTDGVYIVSGSGTSTSDKFTLAVHTK